MKKFKLLFTLIFASLLISFTNISCDISWTTTDETNSESNDNPSNANNNSANTNDSGSSNSPNNTNNNNSNTDDSETETSDTESSKTEPSDTEVVVTSLSISGASEVTVGGTITLTANVTPSTAIVTWSSGDTKIATVNDNGVVTGIKAGSVSITAKAGTKSARKTIKIVAATSSEENEEPENDNLITTATVAKVYFAPGWSEQAVEVTGSFSEGFTYPLPASTAAQWQAQLHLATDAVLSTSKTYKLSFITNTTVAMNNITVKWASDTTNTPAASSMCNSFNTSANTAYNYSYTAIPEENISNAYLILDFGGNAAGTVKISNISLVETSSVTPEAWNDETASAGAEPKKALGTPLNITGLENYKLVWADDFTDDERDSDGTPLSSNWGYDIGRGQSNNSDGTNPNNWAWGNNENQWYSDNDKDNTWVSNGTLKIRAIKETGPDNNATHTSGRIVTRNVSGRQWKYGYIEMRAKIPVERGVWPAFWMLDNDIYNGQGWPLSGEIDIMESSTSIWGVDKVYGTLHCEAGSGAHPIYTAGTVLDDIAGEWHTYAVKWDKNSITWYYDGEPARWTLGNNVYDSTATYTPSDVNSKSAWPYNEPFYIIINLAVGGNLGGTIGNWTESTMTIDYVRVYQK